MDLPLNDRVCLVTGLSTGIGSATALALAAESARMVATACSLDALGTLAAKFQRAGDILGSGGLQSVRSRAVEAGGCDPGPDRSLYQGTVRPR